MKLINNSKLLQSNWMVWVNVEPRSLAQYEALLVMGFGLVLESLVTCFILIK